MTSTQHAFEYQVGGSLSAQAPSYIKRQADHDLYQALQSGHFSYVFNARQMGKSSLRVRTMQRLRRSGICCIALDMTRIGSEHLTPQQWYVQVISELWRGAGLMQQVSLKGWLQEHQGTAYAQLLSRFVDEVLLDILRQPIVIFIDEVDSSLSLDFSIDDFFALIRACSNNRVDDPRYRRLTFCLLGVATPSDLIADKARTPFNIGRAIALTGFTPAEAAGLARGLNRPDPETALAQILQWTGGQPFLTQKLCQLATAHPDQSIETIVQQHIIANWESQDEPAHLRTIRDRLLRNEQRAGRLLGLYREILQRNGIPATGGQGQITLRLSGLVVKQEQLQVYNPIYACVFDLAWVEATLNRLRPYGVAFDAWIASGGSDESRLLRGQALEEALQWAAGRDLSQQDAEFLRASQQFETRETKQANETLAIANRKARRRIRIGAVVLNGAIVVASLLGLQATRMVNRAQAIAQMERQSSDALDQFEFDQTGALLTAMEAAHQLQQMQENPMFGMPDFIAPWAKGLFARWTLLQWFPQNQTHPTSSPVLALQSILMQIQGEQLPYQGILQFTDQGPRLLESMVLGRLTLRDGQGDVISDLDFSSTSVAEGWVSPTGDRVLATLNPDFETGHNAALRLYDGQGNLLAELEGHPSWVEARTDINPGFVSIDFAEFSPDGRYMLTASSDGTVIIWTTEGQKLTAFKPPYGGFRALQFNADGTRVGIAQNDASNIVIQIFDLGGEQLAEFRSPVSTDKIVLSPDLSRTLTVGVEGDVRLWDDQGNQIAELSLKANKATFSPDGRLVAAASGSNAGVWDLEGNRIAAFQTGQDASTRVGSVAFSPDGRQIAIAQASRYDFNKSVISLWTAGGDRLQQLEVPGPVETLRFSPDGRQMVVDGGGRSFYLWQLQGNHLAMFAPSDAEQTVTRKIRFSADGGHVAILDADDVVRVYNRQGQQLATITSRQQVDDMHFGGENSDRLLIGTAGPDEPAVQIWTLDGRQVVGLEGSWYPDWTDPVSLNGLYTATYVGAPTEPDAVRVWNLDGDLVATVAEASNLNVPSALGFSASGEQVAVWHLGYPLRVLNLQNGETASIEISDTLEERGSPWIEAVAFNAEGDRLLTFDGSTADVWDLQGRVASVNTEGTNPISLSGDGQRFAVSGYSVTLWNFELDKIKAMNIRQELNLFWSADLQLNHTGDRVASLGEDSKVRIWNDSGNQLAEFNGYAMALSSDGSEIVVTSREDNSSKLWPIHDLDTLLDNGCDRLRLYLASKDPTDVRQVCDLQASPQQRQHYTRDRLVSLGDRHDDFPNTTQIPAATAVAPRHVGRLGN